MDAWKSNLESVIQKWEKKGPPAHIFEKNPDQKYNAVPNVGPNGSSRNARRRLKPASRTRNDRIKEREYWASLEFSQTPKQFKLTPPVIKPPRAAYQMYQCIKCLKICGNGSLHRADSKPMSLFNVINVNEYARRKSITCWFAPDMDFIISRKMHKYPDRFLSIQGAESVDDDNIVGLKVLEEDTDQQNIQKTQQAEMLSRCKTLVSYINAPITRITSWVVLKFFRRHFSTVCCQRQDISALEEAAKKNIPVIYLPMCASLLDFLIIYFTLFVNNIRLPFTFLQGDRGAGSVTRFILRRLGVSFVDEPGSITTIGLRKHVKELLRDKQSLQISVAGHSEYKVSDQNMASFMIQNLMQCVMQGVIADAIIVPVNITYEEEFHVSSADLWNLPKLLWRGQKSKVNGMAHIRFGHPSSLQDFCSREPKFPSPDWNSYENVSKYGCVSLSSLDKVTCSLLNHVVSDCHHVGVNTCTSILSLLLTTKHKSEVSVEDLEVSFEWLTLEIHDSNRYIGFFGATADVVDYGLKLLWNQQLIHFKSTSVPNSKASRTASLVQDFEKRDRLLEHAHQVIQVFILKSIVATSLIAIAGGASLFRTGQFLDGEMSRNEILSLSKYLCHLLRPLYIISPVIGVELSSINGNVTPNTDRLPFLMPCADIMTSLSDTLDSFITSDILTISKDWRHLNQPKSMALDFGDECLDDDMLNSLESDVRYEMSANEEDRDFILFWHSLIAPTLEKIWFMAACLSEAPFKNEMTVDGFICSVRERFVKRALSGHTFCVSGGDVHNSFVHIANVLVMLGLLEEVRDEQNCSKLKTPAGIERDDKYINFMRKLEDCL